MTESDSSSDSSDNEYNFKNDMALKDASSLYSWD